MLLYREQWQPSTPRLRKLIVVDGDQAPDFGGLWNSDVGKELKALDITLEGRMGLKFYVPATLTRTTSRKRSLLRVSMSGWRSISRSGDVLP
jgi:hypothetical protein